MTEMKKLPIIFTMWIKQVLLQNFSEPEGVSIYLQGLGALEKA